MQSDPVPVKMVVVGDGAIGKTCIIVSYVKNTFPKQYEPTVFDNLATTLRVDNKVVNLAIWDTAGQEEFGTLRPLAYTDTHIFLITFSVTQPTSFTNARKKWYHEIESAAPSAIKIFVGNKVDLRDSATKTAKDPKTAPITKETAKAVIEGELRCKYFECSALTREGLKELFQGSVRSVLEKHYGAKKQQQQVNKKEGSSCSCQLI